VHPGKSGPGSGSVWGVRTYDPEQEPARTPPPGSPFPQLQSGPDTAPDYQKFMERILSEYRNCQPENRIPI